MLGGGRSAGLGPGPQPALELVRQHRLAARLRQRSAGPGFATVHGDLCRGGGDLGAGVAALTVIGGYLFGWFHGTALRPDRRHRRRDRLVPADAQRLRRPPAGARRAHRPALRRWLPAQCPELRLRTQRGAILPLCPDHPGSRGVRVPLLTFVAGMFLGLAPEHLPVRRARRRPRSLASEERRYVLPAFSRPRSCCRCAASPRCRCCRWHGAACAIVVTIGFSDHPHPHNQFIISISSS